MSSSSGPKWSKIVSSANLKFFGTETTRPEFKVGIYMRPDNFIEVCEGLKVSESQRSSINSHIVKRVQEWLSDPDYEFDPNKLIPPRGETILAFACRHGMRDVVEVLLNDKRTDCNKETAAGSTPLAIAVAYQQNDIIELLLRHKANPNTLLKYWNEAIGNTPLSMALRDRNVPAVATLLSFGADATMKWNMKPYEIEGDHRASPFFALKNMPSTKTTGEHDAYLTKLLLHHGGKIEEKNGEGRSFADDIKQHGKFYAKNKILIGVSEELELHEQFKNPEMKESQAKAALKRYEKACIAEIKRDDVTHTVTSLKAQLTMFVHDVIECQMRVKDSTQNKQIAVALGEYYKLLESADTQDKLLSVLNEKFDNTFKSVTDESLKAIALLKEVVSAITPQLKKIPNSDVAQTVALKATGPKPEGEYKKTIRKG